MQMMKMVSVAALVAATTLVGSAIEASAQTPLTNDNGVILHRTHGYSARLNRPRRQANVDRALTVNKAPIAPTAANPSPFSVVTAPIGVAGTIATAPLNGLSQAFGYGPVGSISKPLPIVARYEGVGPMTDSVNQGWAQPVPLAANGPIYKLEPVSNNGGYSPFSVIAAPITAVTTLAATPFNAAGSLVGAAPAAAPVF